MRIAEISTPSRKDIRNAMVLHRVIVRWVENEVVDQTRKALTTCWNKLWRVKADDRLDAVQGLVAESYGKILKTTSDTTEAVIRFTARDLRRVLVRFRAEGIEQTEAELIEAILRKYAMHGMEWAIRLDSYTMLLQAQIMSVITSGMADGLSIAQMARQLRTAFGGARSNAERVVRTETMFASNLAAMETYSSMGDVVAGVEFDATMDSRTCMTCGGYDGREFYYNPDLVGGQRGISECPQPPVHTNCRCFMAPISKSWQELGFKTKSDAPNAASKGEKFPDWLAGQDEKIQRKVMGDYYDLYKLGGFDMAHKALLIKMPVDRLGSEWKELWQKSQPQIEPFRLELPPSTTGPKVRQK